MKLRLTIGFLLLMVAGTSLRGLPFIHDNYPKALAEAKQRKMPIFVECWAPW